MFRRIHLWLIALATLGFVGVLPASTWAADPPKNGNTLELNLGGGVKIELVRIKAGKFMMGSAADDKAAPADEKPPHEVTISKDFFMGKYVVTQEQWVRVMGKNTSVIKVNGKDRPPVGDTRQFPVNRMSFEDARKFCMIVSAATKQRVDLPTEAEWEYACRAGTTTAFYCGDKLTENDANFGKKIGNMTPVGKYAANPWGLYDMTGNVFQFCLDMYTPDYYARSPKADPRNDAGQYHVLRGGSFQYGPMSCRSAKRFPNSTGAQPDIGFRVVVRE